VEEAKKRGRRGLGTVYPVWDKTTTPPKLLRYRASLSETYTDEQGVKRRRRIVADGTSETEAIANLNKKRVDPKPHKPRGTVFKEWVEIWLDSIPETQITGNTRRGYRNALKHLLPYIGDVQVEHLNHDQLNKLIHTTLPKLKDDKGKQLLGQDAQRNIYKVLRNCLNEAVRSSRVNISVSPLALVKAPATPTKRLTITREMEQARGFIKWLDEKNHPDEVRMLFQFLGLRRGERLGLSWNNVKNLSKKDAYIAVEQQLVYEPGKGHYLTKPKTKSGIREIPLTEPFLSKLRTYKKRQDRLKQENPDWANSNPELKDLIFLKDDGTLITLNNDNGDWHRILGEYLNAPVDDEGNARKIAKVSTVWRGHLNRNITATLLSDANVPYATAVKILGWGSQAMARYYDRTDRTLMRKPLENYAEVLTSRVKKN
jgi:integrase